MYWRRIVIFTMTFNCCYPDKYGIPQLDRVAVNENVEYRKEFKNRKEMETTGSLVIWTDRMSFEVAERIANYQCEELRFYPDSACDIDIDIIDTREEIEELPKREAEIIELILTRIKEAETLDEKMALAEEIRGIYRRYGLPAPTVEELIKG
jgi:hypothetical protein